MTAITTAKVAANKNALTQLEGHRMSPSQRVTSLVPPCSVTHSTGAPRIRPRRKPGRAGVIRGRTRRDLQRTDSDLEAEGFQMSPGIQITLLVSDSGYCIEALDQELDANLRYSSTEGTPNPGSCT